MAFFVAKGSEAAAAEEEKGSDLLAAAAFTEALAREGQVWSLGRPQNFGRINGLLALSKVRCL